jgi:dihydrofolate synthase/folylpolyglutamate synthase
MALSFSSFRDTEEYLASIVNYEWVLPDQRPERAFKLERVQEAMDLLGVISSELPAIHIGGTKGKGSTVMMMEAILRAHGLSTGAFMSPHVSTVRERILIDGDPITERDWVDGFNAVAPILDEMTMRGKRLTYFEVTWILALEQFRRRQPDAMLIEVGMGGRLDCTNLIHPRVAVMMPISHDHTKILGKRIAQIAWDKSHILKPSAIAVIAKQNRWAKAEILSRLIATGIDALWYGIDYEVIESNTGQEAGIVFDVRVGDDYFSGLSLSLMGSHQRRNAAVAIAAVQCFLKTMDRSLNPDAIRRALTEVDIPGRLEWGHRNPDVLLDVAHNPASFKALTAALTPLKSTRKIHAIVAFAKGKDSRKCLKILSPFVDDITLVPNGTPRTQDPAKLQKIARQIGMRAGMADNGVIELKEWMAKAGDDLILVAGSFPLVGDCRNYLYSPLHG